VHNQDANCHGGLQCTRQNRCADKTINPADLFHWRTGNYEGKFPGPNEMAIYHWQFRAQIQARFSPTGGSPRRFCRNTRQWLSTEASVGEQTLALTSSFDFKDYARYSHQGLHLERVSLAQMGEKETTVKFIGVIRKKAKIRIMVWRKQ